MDIDVKERVIRFSKWEVLVLTRSKVMLRNLTTSGWIEQ